MPESQNASPQIPAASRYLTFPNGPWSRESDEQIRRQTWVDSHLQGCFFFKHLNIQRL